MPWSVFGPSMSGNSDTKVCRHKKNHVAKIGLSGQKWATFRLVADMSPTLPAKADGVQCNQYMSPTLPAKQDTYVGTSTETLTKQTTQQSPPW